VHLLQAQVCVAIFLATYAAGAYVSGTPGGPWSKEELLTVKSKMYSLFKIGNAPRTLRLSFHDCVLYEDGTGGCDGCLNWEGVDVHMNGVNYAKNFSNMDAGNNNGLGPLVRVLEELYTKTDYPWNALVLNESLKDSGKSRADLWAYAALVAVEWGIEANNMACEDWNNPRVPGSHCVHEPGTEECFVRPSRDIQFQYGRADCTDFDPDFPYKALKKEHHPNPVGDGPTTVDYFKKDFGFTGRETAAIFGAHTFGHPKLQNSLIPYTWTSSAVNMINNDYYKNIVGLDRWFIDDNECRHVGDAYGNKPKTRWVTHTRKMTQRGGPVFWIHQNRVCPSVFNDMFWNDEARKCIEDAGPGQQCRPDPPAGGSDSRLADQEDGDPNRGCERWRLIIGRDEIALNCEMGLYLDFKVTDGVPHGCPGLEHFQDEMANNISRSVWSKTPGQKWGLGQPGCEKQTLTEPAGSTPLYQIMEEYAHDNTVWIDDFTLAFEKMMRNGYSSLENAVAATSANVYCPLPKRRSNMIPCYEKEEIGDGPYFMIGNRLGDLANKVLQYDTERERFTFGDITQEPNQLWKLSVSGTQLINRLTREALIVDGAANFQSDVVGEDFKLIYSPSGKAVDCWNARRVNKPCRLYTSHGGANQKFYMIHLH
jgi:hypothetical protein